MYCVYILKCSDATYYTGITNDVRRRVAEHNADPKGAKYTKARRPVKLVYTEECANRSVAQKRECEIKKLSREKKELLITSK
jgi:putative endonuclease